VSKPVPFSSFCGHFIRNVVEYFVQPVKRVQSCVMDEVM